MNSEERTVVAYHLEQLEDLLLGTIPENRKMEALMHLGAVRKIVTAAHGAQSHAPRPRRTRTAAIPPAGIGTADAS